jgi:tetratricopeptide (TPR) repeat protein
MLKRVLPFLCLAVVLIGAIALSVYAYLKWQRNVQVEAWEITYSDAKQLLQAGDSTEALELLNTHFSPKQAGPDQQKWPPLMVQAALDSHAYSQLESLVATYPGVLMENESAALWWMRAQMHLKAPEPAEKLRAQWPESKRKLPNRWRLLEADELVRAGEVSDALDSLNSWQGQGHDEVNRQLRIALLAGDDSTAILEALNAAYVAMPRSAELRAISAEFLERMGDTVQARRNYIAAFLLEPENPLYGHLLAKFYLRLNAMPQAIQTWRDCYAASGDQRAWWDAWFWERVTRSRGEALPPSVGEWWGALTQLLAETPNDAFLSSGFLAEYVRPPAILTNSEAYYWLWTLELIREQDEAAALDVLRNMPKARTSVAPELRVCLQALLEWRVEGIWPRGVAFNANARVHRWLRFLEDYRPTKAPDASEPLNVMESFLASDYAVGSLLLANGWLAAADRLLPGPVPATLYENEPALSWLPFADTKSQAALYGSSAGMARGEAYVDDLAVQGLVGEFLLLNGDIPAGLAQLSRVAATPGPVGYRAAYLVALAALEQDDWERFNAILAQRQDLLESVAGQELQARAALAQGDRTTAAAVYTDLGAESVEGCVFRYQTALERGDYKAARAVLAVLLDLAPNEPKFRQWLDDLNTRDG